MNVCDFEPCRDRAVAKGLCARHYYQRRRGATLTMPNDAEATSAAVVDAWREQDGCCAFCKEKRVNMPYRLRGEAAICDVCARVLQATEDPGVLEEIALALIDERSQS